MKPTPTIADITRALRNRTTPAARLARWQTRRAPSQLAALRQLPTYAGNTLAERRAYRLGNYDSGPELSAPDAPTPTLWTNEDSPLVSHYWPGRTFLSHRGWYTDEHQQDTLEAAAVILADFPGLIFEAVRSSWDDGLRVDLTSAERIDYSDADSSYAADDIRRDAARDTVRRADSVAQRMAEDEREFQEMHRHELDLEEARADLNRNRATFRRLARELRQLCPSALAETYPAAAEAIRAQVAAILADRRDLLETIAEHKQALA
jgi:hypothetical protein